MRLWRNAAATAAVCVCLGAESAEAIPADFSFVGTFNQDDNVQLFNFTANGSSLVTLRSYSYAGGTQANGNAVLAGGFDPILALFDASGNLVHDQDDAEDDGNVVPADPVTGRHFDVLFDQVLTAGAYTVAISEFNNFAVGPALSNGFSRQGQGNFTGVDCSVAGGSFLDTGFDDCNQRTNAWAFDVLNVESAAAVTVPEPSTAALLSLVLAGFWFVGWRQGSIRP
jgi:PEP-CTERM motif